MAPRAAGELFHYQVLNINTSFLWLSNTHVKNVDSFQRTSRWSLLENSRTRESEQTLIDRNPRPIRKLGKGERGICFCKRLSLIFQAFVKITQMLRPVFMSKSATEVAYRFCAYLSFRPVIPGAGGRGVLLGILDGGVPTGFPILVLFTTRKCHFSHPFSDRAFRKLCHPSYLD